MIVADTTLGAYLVIDGPFTVAARGVFARDQEWIAPALWRTELVNVMATNIRAGTFGLDEAVAKIALADRIVKTSTEKLNDRAIIEMAVADKNAAYDCTFVWFAQNRMMKLVSGDKMMVAKHPEVAVSLQDFADGK